MPFIMTIIKLQKSIKMTFVRRQNVMDKWMVIEKRDKVYRLVIINDKGLRMTIANGNYTTENGAKRGAAKYCKMFNVQLKEV